MPPPAIDLPPRVIDEAIGWAVKIDFSQPGQKTQQAFRAWLAACATHAVAWQRVQALRNEFASIPPKLALETLQSADARRDADRLSRRRAVKLLTFFGVATMTGMVSRNYVPWENAFADISTGVGEQRTVRLADGSVIVLNTDSAVSTDLQGDRRVITLHCGEILVVTGADSNAATKRPFWVHTPFGTMQALGTRFVVRLEPDRARISVTEGAVRMHSADNTSAVGRAGESWWLTDAGAEPATERRFLDDGWADGVIAGKNMRLADLVAELSRYRRGRIVCDERIANLRISGVYHVRDTDRALQFLAQTQPVRVDYRSRFWVTVAPA